MEGLTEYKGEHKGLMFSYVLWDVKKTSNIYIHEGPPSCPLDVVVSTFVEYRYFKTIIYFCCKFFEFKLNFNNN